MLPKVLNVNTLLLTLISSPAFNAAIYVADLQHFLNGTIGIFPAYSVSMSL